MQARRPGGGTPRYWYRLHFISGRRNLCWFCDPSLEFKLNIGRCETQAQGVRVLESMWVKMHQWPMSWVKLYRFQ